MDNFSIRKPIFVVGPPRTGTTLLRNCLNAHPSIFILPETHFFLNIYGKRFLSYLPPPFYNQFHRVSGLISRLLDKSSMSPLHSTSEILEYIETHSYDQRDLLSLIMNYFTSQKGAEITGEKSPTHFLFIPLIQKWYPDCRILFLQRDPKLVAASYIHNRPKHTYDTRARTLQHIAALLKLASVIYKRYEDTCNAVSYHELTHQPKIELRRICNILQLSFDDQMLKPGVNNSSYWKNPGYHTDLSYEIIPQNRDKWKKVLTEQEASNIEQLVYGREKITRKKLGITREIIRLKMKRILSLFGVNPF